MIYWNFVVQGELQHSSDHVQDESKVLLFHFAVRPINKDGGDCNWQQ